MQPLSLTVNDIDSSSVNSNDEELTRILFFGEASLDIPANTLILNATMNYITLPHIFEESLLYCFVTFYYMFISSLFSIPFYILMSFLETVHLCSCDA